MLLKLENKFDFLNPDYNAVFRERFTRLLNIRHDTSGRILAIHKEIYKDNPVQFIEDWMVTYDPRKKLSYMPFMLFQRQKEYILWLKKLMEEKSDGLVEKSRDVGASWLNMAFSIWAFLFADGVKIGFGSRKEALVDRIGDPDSILEKGRMIIESLPKEFRPEKYELAFMKFQNLDNGARITGEAGDNIGRGGRNTIYFKDESAFYERPERIEAALSQNSDVKIDVSTPNGNGNPFYKKRFGGKIPVFVFDWRDDPRKDEAWYQKQKDMFEPWILAQEVDRDYNASVEGICIPAKWVKAAIDFQVEPSGEKVAGLDVADEGADANAYIQIYGIAVQHIETWKEGDTTQTARKAWGYALEDGLDQLNFDSIGVGAGVKGELNSLVEKNGAVFTVHGVNSGSSDLPGLYENTEKLNKDMFANIRAKMWWNLRRRFEKTYEVVNKIKQHHVDELISIPNNTDLISEISQPLKEINDSGKILIESKKKMRIRGIPSPNLADALCLAFYRHSGFFEGLV